LTEEQTDALQRLAGQVVAQLKLRQRPTRTTFSQEGLADGSEGKGADGILGESEALYRTLSETVSDAIIVIDEDGKILLVNRATEKIFGYRKEELLGQQLTMLMPDCPRQVNLQAVQQCVETGGLHKGGDEI
jgi:PAS domain-containing protein